MLLPADLRGVIHAANCQCVLWLSRQGAHYGAGTRGTLRHCCLLRRLLTKMRLPREVTCCSVANRQCDLGLCRRDVPLMPLCLKSLLSHRAWRRCYLKS